MRGHRLSIDLPRMRISPSRGRSSPLIVRSVVVLPAPLAPISATISPGVDRERDALQRMHVPVVGVDVADLQDRAQSS